MDRIDTAQESGQAIWAGARKKPHGEARSQTHRWFTLNRNEIGGALVQKGHILHNMTKSSERSSRGIVTTASCLIVTCHIVVRQGLCHRIAPLGLQCRFAGGPGGFGDAHVTHDPVQIEQPFGHPNFVSEGASAELPEACQEEKTLTPEKSSTALVGVFDANHHD